MATKLYVGNLAYGTTEDHLKEYFAGAGAIASVTIVTDPATGRSRGFGFVEFDSAEDATRAIEMFNGQDFMQRNLVVNEARPKPKGGGGYGGGGGGGYGGGGGGGYGGGGGGGHHGGGGRRGDRY